MNRLKSQAGSGLLAVLAVVAVVALAVAGYFAYAGKATSTSKLSQSKSQSGGPTTGVVGQTAAPTKIQADPDASAADSDLGSAASDGLDDSGPGDSDLQ
jgi:type II secretory pathway component PulK